MAVGRASKLSLLIFPDHSMVFRDRWAFPDCTTSSATAPPTGPSASVSASTNSLIYSVRMIPTYRRNCQFLKATSNRWQTKESSSPQKSATASVSLHCTCILNCAILLLFTRESRSHKKSHFSSDFSNTQNFKPLLRRMPSIVLLISSSWKLADMPMRWNSTASSVRYCLLRLQTFIASMNEFP